jgi:beta-galactosidase GanA
MKNILNLKALIIICIVALFATQCTQNNSGTIPHLEKRGLATQLIVNGKPFLALGGELLNSSSSGLKYMDTIWPKLEKMNMNTVLGGVSWDLIEPVEGKFDFTLVDSMIMNAEKHNMKLVVLWFGSWKNGMSHYAPEWVKKDTARFPRVRIANGKKLEILSAFSKNNVQADAKAFAALMKHIKTVDAKKQTVIMVQVENEVGIIGDSRDRSKAANNVFLNFVPNEFMNYLRKNKSLLLPEFKTFVGDNMAKTLGNWELVFGKSTATDEVFMAWSYAQYVNQVVAAGKKEYPLPMYVNAWIVQPQDKNPGDYPSGGPQAHLHDVWRAGAPNLDFLSPDIYLPDFVKITQQYARSKNPMFIPESFAGTTGAANAFYVIGQLNGMGYSPFGIETREQDPGKGPMSNAYKVLGQLAPVILDAQKKGTIAAVILNKTDSVQTIHLGNYNLKVELRADKRGNDYAQNGYGILINSGFDEYIIAGADIEVSFFTTDPTLPTVGLASVFEGTFENGNWVPGRQLNGDEIMKNYDFAGEALKYSTGTVARLKGTTPGILKVKLYRY